MIASDSMLSETTVLSVMPIAVVSVVLPRLSTSVRDGNADADIAGDDCMTRVVIEVQFAKAC